MTIFYIICVAQLSDTYAMRTTSIPYGMLTIIKVYTFCCLIRIRQRLTYAVLISVTLNEKCDTTNNNSGSKKRKIFQFIPTSGGSA